MEIRSKINCWRAEFHLLKGIQQRGLIWREFSFILQLSLYIGVLLNIPIYFKNYYQISDARIGLLLGDAAFGFIACAFFLSAISLFGRQTLKLGSILFTLISVAACYYIWFFDVVVGYGMVQAIFGTEFALMSESFDGTLIIFIVIFSLLPSFLINRFAANSTTPWAFLLPRALFLILLVFCLVGINHYFKIFRSPIADGREPTNPMGVATYSYVPSNWTSALVISVANKVINYRLSRELIDPMDKYGFYSNVLIDDLFIVIVIGESARHDHMSLMGYQRETTPLLDKEPNLIGFKGASCNTSTKLSLACMFVREGGAVDTGSPTQQYIFENHVFSVLKKLGLSIDVLAMQSESRFYFGIDADKVKIREQIGAESSRNEIPIIDDMLLVDQLKQSIAVKNGGHLVILHQKGSHFDYKSRYPASFSKFEPDCEGLHCSYKEMINSYDNSIAYTDYFLFSVLEELRDKKAFLLYASDHGESLDDGNFFHASPKDVAPKEQFEIPMIIWASDKFLEDKKFSRGFAAARKHEKEGKILRHSEIFESLLGCIGIKSRADGIRPLNNWCDAD
tara:strand:- start:995 stop:2692 length:1698 start_codon:yes stop_codon:yes gene_type:complete